METREQVRRIIEWLCDGDRSPLQRERWTVESLIRLGAWADNDESADKLGEAAG